MASQQPIQNFFLGYAFITRYILRAIQTSDCADLDLDSPTNQTIFSVLDVAYQLALEDEKLGVIADNAESVIRDFASYVPKLKD